MTIVVNLTSFDNVTILLNLGFYNKNLIANIKHYAYMIYKQHMQV